MGEQDFTIMSSKNQQAFDSKINKISEKKKYSWRQGLYNNKINLNWQTGNYNLNRKKKTLDLPVEECMIIGSRLFGVKMLSYGMPVCTLHSLLSSTSIW